MAQLVVRNIEDSVKQRLQRRAKRHGRSMEEEVRDILRNAAVEEDRPADGLGTEIASLFSGIGIDFEIPELRGFRLKPPAESEPPKGAARPHALPSATRRATPAANVSCRTVSAISSATRRRESAAPAPVEVTQNASPVEPAVAQEETQQTEQPEATKGPMDMLARLLRGESARPDQS